MGNNQAAEKDLSAAIASTPKASYLVARSAATKDTEPQKALTDVNTALELEPNNQEALKLRAAIFGKLKYPDKAVQDLNTALRMNPLDESIIYNRAQVYMQLGKLDLAMNDVMDALQVDPNNYIFYLARAYLYHKQGNDALAQEDIKRAQFCNPTLPKSMTLKSIEMPATAQAPSGEHK